MEHTDVDRRWQAGRESPRECGKYTLKQGKCRLTVRKKDILAGHSLGGHLHKGDIWNGRVNRKDYQGRACQEKMTGPWGAPYFGVLEEKAMNGMKGRQCLEEKKQGTAVFQNQGEEFQEGNIIDYPKKKKSQEKRGLKKMYWFCTDQQLFVNCKSAILILNWRQKPDKKMTK